MNGVQLVTLGVTAVGFTLAGLAIGCRWCSSAVKAAETEGREAVQRVQAERDHFARMLTEANQRRADFIAALLMPGKTDARVSERTH